jgi:hypothetical protein
MVIRLLARLAFVAASRVSLAVILKQFNFQAILRLGAPV